MKINCEIMGEDTPFIQATGLFWDFGKLTLFFGQQPKKVLMRPEVKYMSTGTCVIVAEEEPTSGMGKLPPQWRIRVDYE